MPKSLRAALFLFSLAIGGAGSLQAQGMTSVLPKPIENSHPKAQSALQVVQHLLTGDADAALNHLEKSAAPSLRAGGKMEEQVRTLATAVGADGAYLVDGLMDLGHVGVLVRLQHTDGGKPRTLIVQMEPRAPYRITHIQDLDVQMQTR